MKFKINASWFQGHIDHLQMSRRKLAKHLGIDPAAVSYMLSGQRAMKLKEAAELARLFGAPIEEVLNHAGLVSDGVKSTDTIKIAGWIDGKARVHFGEPKGRKQAPRPALGGPKLKVLRFQTQGASLEAFDGGLAYYKENADISPEAIGRLSIIELLEKGGPIAGVLKRGYGAGLFNIYDPAGAVLAEDVKVRAASPVLWLKI